jgi:hypothetical protein
MYVRQQRNRVSPNQSQALLGEEAWSGNKTFHGQGAAQILKYRGEYYDKEDRFESELLLTLRGPVVRCLGPINRGSSVVLI